MFPIIENISDILPYVKDKANIRINENDNGTTSINYTTITDNKLFNCEYARECRGITFDTETGKILIRPFQKFFNIGEMGNTPDNLNWDNVKSFTEKIDGSICSTVVLNGKVVAKSMSSFDSVHANRMTKFISNSKALTDFCFNISNMGYTPIFEYVSPEFQIVIPYEKEDLILLAVRHNITGTYKNLDDIAATLFNHNISVIQDYTNRGVDYSDLRAMLEEFKDIEGYVIQFNDGHMVKAKTLWYTQLHRCKAMLSEKNVAEACLTGDVDDIVGMMTTMGLSTARVVEINAAICDKLNNIVERLNMLYDLYNFEYDKNGNRGRKSRKNFALDYKHDECFSLVMRKIDQKEIDPIGFYRKRVLPKHFGNDSVII